MDWFQIQFLGEAETVIKSQFGDVGLSLSLHFGPVFSRCKSFDGFLGCLFIVFQEKVSNCFDT